MMRKHGFVTQCDSGGIEYNARCPATMRLEKPRRWRCDECVKIYGPRPAEEKP